MRTNIDIDEALMEAAMMAGGFRTKKETVEAALRVLARQRKACARLGALRGKVDWDGDYDYKALRRGRARGKLILVASSVWIDYLRGAATRQSEHLARRIDAAEVLQGFRSEKQAREAAAAFDLIETMEIDGRALAIKSARNYRLLRAKGVTVRSTSTA